MKARTILATTAILAAASAGAISATPAHAQDHAPAHVSTPHLTPVKAASSTFVAHRLPRSRAMDCTLRGDAARLTPTRMLKDGNYIVEVDRAQVSRAGAVALTVTVQRYADNHGECPQTDAGGPVHTVVPASSTVGVLGMDNDGPTALTGPAWMLPRITNPAWTPGSQRSFSSGPKHYRVPASVATSLWGNSLAHLTVKHGKVATFQVLYQA